VRHIAQLHSVTPDEEREGGQQRDRERERKKGVYKVPSFERFERRNIRFFLRSMIGGM
jgi:hypothetical protein